MRLQVQLVITVNQKLILLELYIILLHIKQNAAKDLDSQESQIQ